MRLIFLPSSMIDLRWFKQYYISVFPEGKAKADKQFLSIIKILKANPYIGRSSDVVKGAREYSVLKTPFSFIYCIRKDCIEVVRVIDNRSDWA